MRLARTLLALATLCTAAACADGASRLTGPADPARSEADGGWAGSGNSITSSDDAVAPADSAGGRSGGWAGSGN